MTKQNLVTGQGETFTLDIQYNDSNNTPVDLTGHSAQLVLTNIGIKTDIGTYAATVNSTGGIAIKVTDEVTTTWPVGKAAYRVEHLSPAGDVKWLCYGALTVVDGSHV